MDNKNEYISNKIKSYYKNKFKEKQIKMNMKNKNIKDHRKGGFYKVYNSIKNRIYRIFQQNNIAFNMTYLEILGCSLDRLEEHIINGFTEGMTIDNHGEWEVDHIIPISSFNFEDKKNITVCFNYKNLQPLWKSENRSKYNKIKINNICE